MNARFRPLQWHGPTTPASERRSFYSFRASWPNTLELLQRELGYLEARDVVIEADFGESDLRQDGWPRANARQPSHPGIRIAFTSKHGPLIYATDAYANWQHNVRAIALGLEALRAVDRYGITRTGEQYTGWRQIADRPHIPTTDERTEAARLIRDLAGETGGGLLTGIRDDPELRRKYVRRASRVTHPDTGGSAREFAALQAAVAILEGAS
jgi:hypothetical protein